MRNVWFLIALFLGGFWMQAQEIISGRVVDDSGQPIIDAKITSINDNNVTFSGLEGEFRLEVAELPTELFVDYGNGNTEKLVVENATGVLITKPSTNDQVFNIDEVVVSATRTEQSILEAPVTIEKVGLRQIKNSASADFYEELRNVKGVQVNTNSLTFQSVNTRGFATFANTRFVQLLDGIDNSSPALNFPLGNLIGANELDVESMELMPGASSALYGANAFNGILFLNTKDPFKHQGISAFFKGGVTVQDLAGTNGYYNMGLRVAKQWDDKWGVKFNLSYLTGTDWAADDNADINGVGPGSLNYNGVNLFGDEVSTNINGVAQALESGGLIPPGASALVPSVNVSRTGYRETDLTDYQARSLKGDVGIYRKLGKNMLSWQSRFGNGDAVYQGASRYYLNDFFLHHHKLEFSGDNFLVRTYATFENAGDSYDIRFTGINLNRTYNPDNNWYGEYVGAYLQSVMAGADENVAHANARAFADTNRLQPGTNEFRNAFDAVIGNPDVSQGSKFVDKTSLWHSDAFYNFENLFDLADVLVGGSFRRFSLNSEGTIFNDADGRIGITEYALYTQVQKEIIKDKLDFTGSIRLDKNENFDASWSPRLSLVYTLDDRGRHHIRTSFQTGFRNPDTQSQFIALDVGNAILLGSTQENLANYTLSTGSGTLSGTEIYNNSYTAASAAAFAATGDPAVLEQFQQNLLKQEEVRVWEIGYKAALPKWSWDINAYYSSYNDFSVNRLAVAPLSGSVTDQTGILDLANGNTRVFQFYGNANDKVKSYGVGVSIDRKLGRYFQLNFAYNWNDFDSDDEDPDLETSFNTPEHAIRLGFGTTDFINKHWGFQLNYRWDDAYFWESSFVDGAIPARHVMDAQVSYKLSGINGQIRLGANNLFNNNYLVAPGSGRVGSIYYVGLTLNP